MTEPDYLGLGTTLRSNPSELLAATAFTHELQAAPYLWPGLDAADQAHVVALARAGVVDGDRARRLVAGLRRLAAEPFEPSALRPEIGDVYNNRDALVRDRLGADAGWVHLGRARREATTIAWQLCCRQRLLGLGAALTELVATLNRVATAHTDTLMSDFTYLHHAHPTTLAHYLLAHAFPVTRDIERVDRAVGLVNRSPAGSGSVNGSVFPLDRQLLADLLGFDGVVEHTRDAMWAPDMALEPMFVVMSTLTVIDRIAEELQLWTTEEFGYVHLHDRHCRTSVVMPQKRNPYSLTWLRGHARHGSQQLGAIASTMLTVSGQPDNRTFAYLEVPRSIDGAIAAIRLLTEVLRDATFDTERLADAASSGHSYATDLCDHLTLTQGLDNRAAHRLVGRAVRAADEAGRTTVTPDDLGLASAELQIELVLPAADELACVIEPRAIVEGRNTPGGAGPGPVAEMLDALGATVERWRRHWEGHPLNDFQDAFVASVDDALTD